ncbi:apoptosis inducing factor [Aspergillus heteromorphus CBS 117.55]|uniref:Apoptosis inducing factor n=1 Tax=Aspergillus heteromorphus CBS 117.55 TaxID=1448321 RepID=A0A317WVM3_9EURO|nr:apoptosis inducing factor [Aspergillus heteromorphus CBS 117.55]PWY89881.1 apoptosis inducing factor [Aspergillus heteromorphus CBS 117.55]
MAFPAWSWSWSLKVALPSRSKSFAAFSLSFSGHHIIPPVSTTPILNRPSQSYRRIHCTPLRQQQQPLKMPSATTPPPSPSPEYRVLIVGGSYGGLCAALTLLDLSHGKVARFNFTENAQPPARQIPMQITVVDERDGFYHLIGSPQALASEEYASKTWTKFADIPALQSPSVRFVQGSVSSVDCQTKIAQILDTETQETRKEKYDFLIASSGLRRGFPTVPQSLRREEFLSETRTNVDAIRHAQDGVVVIGGGAVGVEIATELRTLYPTQKITLIHSRDRLLSAEPLPTDFQDRVASVVRDSGVKLILGQRVISTATIETEGGRKIWHLTLTNGRSIYAGHVMNAVSKSVPTSSYLPQEALDQEGYVPILPSTQFPPTVPNATQHFAIGDLASWSAIKRCGGAMHMAYHAASNAHQLMLSADKPEYITLEKSPPCMGLALGKTAVTYTADQGTRDGESEHELWFGKDMGYSICWNYMKLGEPWKA